MTIVDRGLWITWYDLPEEGRDRYLSWLHENYIPELLKRPGFLWGAHYADVGKELRKASTHKDSAEIPRALDRGGARLATHHTDDPSVPTGSRYILLFGAGCADVFGNPVPSALNSRLPEASRKMLAMRIGERVNIMAESGRVEGPDAKTYQGGMLLANCIQLGAKNASWQFEEEMMAWYVQDRLPMMGALPGCVRTRRLASVAGWAKHGVLYEYSSLEARNKGLFAYRDAHPEMRAWSDRMFEQVHHAPGSANLALRLWPPV